MSLQQQQQQQRCHTVVDIIREPVCDRPRQLKKENGKAAYASRVSCPNAGCETGE
ncbi:hypothetical protein ALC62_05838 [Cyphomyrmex costatus]|uniref:Uncharacterized protein n=1 Tax=Cyphomyrmex costatus TaxID=456900 RepID=A0A151IJE3_9HYME|nr:hypothetical protein ALC62_05838 [Cyphomyrmex costatus]